MQNLSDEDIDRLFKRAAEKQQTQFDPADWDNMASRLDANKRPWLNYYTGTGSMVLLGVVIWLGWFINKPTVTELSSSVSSGIPKEATSMMDKSVDALNASSSTTSAQSSFTEVVEKVDESQTASVQLNSVTPTNRKAVDKERHDGKSSDESKLMREKPSSMARSGTSTKSQNLSPPISINKFNQTEFPNESQRLAKPVTEIDIETSDVVKNKSNALGNSNFNLNEGQLNTIGAVAETGAVLPGEGSILKEEQINTAGSLTSKQNSNPRWSARNDETPFVSLTDLVEEIVDENENVLENKELKKGLADSTSKQSMFSRFAVRATIAPDFSSEQFNSFDKMGFNYGLVVEYFLNKNISVTTGALWSRKYYSAVDVEYNGYHADRADGDCRMWDIPLNVNYYFTPSKKYSFFASAGFSSYLMNEENYDYEVDTNYGTKTYTSQIIKENNEWFKILNVSVGLQKQINSRFAIQVEPFVKVPLSGVGEGNISLASFGGFFSIRYNFLTSKNENKNPLSFIFSRDAEQSSSG